MKMFVKARFVLLALMMGLCTLSAFPAQASHYRYANLSYKPTGNPGEIEFQFRFGIRQVNPPAVGTVVGFETFVFGDGSSRSIYLKVVANSVAESWYVGDMVQSPADQVPVRKTYTGAGPYTAGFSSCCRIAEVGGGSLAAQTIVRPFSGNSSPVSSALPILTVPSGPAGTFQLPAQDPDGDALRYRLASFSESGINPPANMSINASTGQVTWNNSALNKSISYAAQFIVEDLDLAGNVKTRIPVDVLLKINSNAGTAPIAEIHTHMDGQPEHGPITVPFGTPISFHVHGSDIDPGATVTLNTDGLPSGATMTPILPTTASGNVDSHFNWTPVKAQIGTYVLSFSATDNSGFQTLTSITVNVINNATIANNDSYATVANQSLAVAAPGVLGNDVDQDNDALTAILVGNPANGSVTLNANGSFNYTPNAGFSGVDSFRYKANDGTADSNFATVSITVQPLSLGIDDAAVIEGNSGVAGAAFIVTLSPASSQPVTVQYSTGNNTAFAPSDYASTSGTLTFAPGEKTKTITVPVKGDEVFEADETFFVNLSNAAGATIDDAQGAGTIVNDDSVGSAGGQIAFQSATGNNADIYVINADGSNKTRLTDHPAWDGAPAFDSTGSRIVFHSNRNGNYDLYIMNADGSGETRLTTNTADDQNPSFSPDGSKIIFISARDIYEMNVDGTGLVRLTNSTVTESSPVYSPDGSKIAYHTEDGNNSEIYVMDANGGNAVRLTTNTVIDGSPKFRSDGGRIVFSRDVNGSNLQQIHVMNPDGTSQARLSNSGQQEFRPVYSPEGSKIAFVRSSDIWLMNADSSGQIQLTSGIASDHAPSWAPGYVVNPNTAPVAQDVTLTTNEDTPLNGTLSATDAEGNALIYSKVVDPAHGSVTVSANGSFTYTPHANYHGPDSFTFKANDGTVDSNVATVNVSVTAINDAPVASDDTATTDEDTALDINAKVNDTDVDGDTLSVTAATATNGEASINTDGTIKFTPAANFNGEATITYTVSDGNGGSDEGTVKVTVKSVNDAPVAAGLSASTDEDTVLNGTVSASDGDGDALTYSLVSVPAHGSVTVTADGSFTYTLDANYNGPDSFTFKAKDGALESNTATVSITVKAVNDAPVAVDDAAATTSITPVSGNVLVNDTDVEGDTLSATVVDQPAHGELELNADGSFTYVPDVGFAGTDSFTYRAGDGADTSNVATVTIAVTQPATTRGGKVTGGGTVTDADGERVAFSLNVQSNAKEGSVKGTISYGNSGGNVSIRSTTITGLVVTGSGARIFGKATINGFGSYDFVVDVFDNGEPGTGDTFYIQLSNDYSSGGEMLLSGNIQVHK